MEAEDLTVEGIYEFRNAFLHVLIDEPAKLMCSEWLRKPTSEEYRAATYIFIKYLRQNHLHFWIQDTTNLGDVAAEDLKWVAEVLVPVANTSGLQKIARITDVDKNMHSFKNLTNPDLFKQTQVEVQQFSTYREAVTWIEEQTW
ncbi:MAG: hypothetical protein ACO1OF_08265 [Adhaeribacter sp.]